MQKQKSKKSKFDHLEIGAALVIAVILFDLFLAFYSFFTSTRLENSFLFSVSIINLIGWFVALFADSD